VPFRGIRRSAAFANLSGAAECRDGVSRCGLGRPAETGIHRPRSRRELGGIVTLSYRKTNPAARGVESRRTKTEDRHFRSNTNEAATENIHELAQPERARCESRRARFSLSGRESKGAQNSEH
jgi:hypothetical protein